MDFLKKLNWILQVLMMRHWKTAMDRVPSVYVVIKREHIFNKRIHAHI